MTQETVTLLDTDRLFYQLLKAAAPDHVSVFGDLDVDDFGDLPVVTFFATASRTGNGNGLWSGTLAINVFADPAEAFDVAKHFYTAVWGWEGVWCRNR